MKVSTEYINKVLDSFKLIGMTYVDFANETGFSLNRLHRIRQNRMVKEEEQNEIIELFKKHYPQKYEAVKTIIEQYKS